MENILNPGCASLESKVKYYGTIYPACYVRSKGAYLYDTEGKKYLDFLSGCGALNYGHNEPSLKETLLRYIESDGVSLGLDLDTPAREDFKATFEQLVLKKLKFGYKIQFCGPTGTNSVEAALKLAEKFTGRDKVVAFEGGFHGMTKGALSVSSLKHRKKFKSLARLNAEFLPFPVGPSMQIENWLSDVKERFEGWRANADLPCAIIIEVIQAEGGIKVAHRGALAALRDLCDLHGVLLVFDEVQVGCGRTGSFFAFESIGVYPDLITVAKSISGYGLPMSLLLIRDKFDVWLPGEHSGTFRGNNLAFATGAAALKKYWSDDLLSKAIQEKSELMIAQLFSLREKIPEMILDVRGKGLIIGVECGTQAKALAVRKTCFHNGLILECCGENSSVVKLMPPITIEWADLEIGLSILSNTLSEIDALSRVTHLLNIRNGHFQHIQTT